MSLEEKLFHIAECDVCNDAFTTTDSKNHTPFESQEKLIRALKINEWVVKDSKTVCPSCEENTRQLQYK
jgi:C4-type Zn-finger protein